MNRHDQQIELQRRLFIFGCLVVLPLLIYIFSYIEFCVRVDDDLQEAIVADVDPWMTTCRDACYECIKVIGFDRWFKPNVTF